MTLVKITILPALSCLLPALLFAADETYQPVSLTPPPPAREFRGAWISEVTASPDWPSSTSLSVAAQKAELVSLFDRAVQLKLNAIILQVRSSCDAVYASPLEPWSEYLTGAMGRAPKPFYDPLTFAVAEAHKRGLELHAWINPFRVLRAQAKSPPALNHISQTHPELVRRYGDQLYLDPGEPAARTFVTRVVQDIVRRYDVDGIHFDDYFYPYPQKNSSGQTVSFPDYASWKQFGVPSGLSRDDWRRQNINQFIEGVYHAIKSAKPWVKFGISPFGIWRPRNPPSIRGLDAYAGLYADSRLWLANGWVDYFAPQLYWAVDAPQQSFPVLLKWWTEQNVKGRNLWPGLDAAAVGGKFTSAEIARQMQIIRHQAGADGEIFFHLRSVLDNRTLSDAVRAEYSQPALVPASPWLDATPPEKPKLFAGQSTRSHSSQLNLRWENGGGEPAWLWVLQFRMHGTWTTEILPADQTSRFLEDRTPDAISIRAVDRTGNLSAPMVLALQKNAPAQNSSGMASLNWPANK
jgi:uncharacterized lipoprotein YddW (UPF0748 family)